MKTMTSKQLGGACEKEFTANSFDEIADISKTHGMEMFQANDKDHLKAMDDIKEQMKNPKTMGEWFEKKEIQIPIGSRSRILYDGLVGENYVEIVPNPYKKEYLINNIFLIIIKIVMVLK